MRGRRPAHMAGYPPKDRRPVAKPQNFPHRIGTRQVFDLTVPGPAGAQPASPGTVYLERLGGRRWMPKAGGLVTFSRIRHDRSHRTSRRSNTRIRIPASAEPWGSV